MAAMAAAHSMASAAKEIEVGNAVHHGPAIALAPRMANAANRERKPAGQRAGAGCGSAPASSTSQRPHPNNAIVWLRKLMEGSRLGAIKKGAATATRAASGQMRVGQPAIEDGGEGLAMV